MQSTIDRLPEHLKKYVVDQNYSKYTSEDQSVWRYILRQLKHFLKKNAHSSYIDGLTKTGIEESAIPRVEYMDQKLKEFGWSAVPISGFIPPAAFMEFQSLSVLPIASDLRTLDHIHYTPAPDIIHETAGHAPILIDPDFSEYLKKYATIASKAIFSNEDLLIYEAIRDLSDKKENPDSTSEEIKLCEQHLNKMVEAISYTSEASLLSRMNWWTAEYGLIGDLDNPKIFGAGLLSSIGEARSCLLPAVKKIPLTIDCIKYTYDITEPQPQLFVTENFENLSQVLNDLSELMSYKKGGKYGLDRALESKTVNTIELNSGLQISGILKSYRGDENPHYLQLEGPSQLSENRKQLSSHGCKYHLNGFGSPIGPIDGKCPSTLSEEVFKKNAPITFDSGVVVDGEFVSSISSAQGALLVVTFNNCTVTYKDEILFDPAWGTFDMAMGSIVNSVFGGPADRAEYGDRIDFQAKFVTPRNYSTDELNLHQMYSDIRNLRDSHMPTESKVTLLRSLVEDYKQHFVSEWLVGVELYELATIYSSQDAIQILEKTLNDLGNEIPKVNILIKDGLEIAKDECSKD